MQVTMPIMLLVAARKDSPRYQQTTSSRRWAGMQIARFNIGAWRPEYKAVSGGTLWRRKEHSKVVMRGWFQVEADLGNPWTC